MRAADDSENWESEDREAAEPRPATTLIAIPPHAHGARKRGICPVSTPQSLLNQVLITSRFYRPSVWYTDGR